MPLSDPKGGGGRSATSDPPPGPQIDDWGGAQGFSYGHGHGHASCKNLNNYRAKRGLWVQHRLQHQVE